MIKFETWACFPNKEWVRTGLLDNRESCENAIAFAKQYNPTTLYEIREVQKDATD